jgi:hypothetical protein
MSANINGLRQTKGWVIVKVFFFVFAFLTAEFWLKRNGFSRMIVCNTFLKGYHTKCSKYFSLQMKGIGFITILKNTSKSCLCFTCVINNFTNEFWTLPFLTWQFQYAITTVLHYFFCWLNSQLNKVGSAKALSQLL